MCSVGCAMLPVKETCLEAIFRGAKECGDSENSVITATLLLCRVFHCKERSPPQIPRFTQTFQCGGEFAAIICG